MLSGSDDAQICLWDICAATKGVNTLEARQIFRDHSGVVEVQFPVPGLKHLLHRPCICLAVVVLFKASRDLSQARLPFTRLLRLQEGKYR